MTSNSRLVAHELEALSRILQDDETVQWGAAARRDATPDHVKQAPTLGGIVMKGAVKAFDPRPSSVGLLAITDSRLLYLDGRGKRALRDSFPLDSVRATEWEAGLLLGALTIKVADTRVRYTRIPKTDGKEISRLLQRR